MIGKPEWFRRRKYTGWGITPKTWQGWVYIALVILPFAIFQAIPIWNITTRFTITIIWIIFLVVDVTDIMVRMKKDEREKIHEAIAERNALWVIMLVLVLGLVYQLLSSGINEEIKFDPIIVIALAAAVIVKAISNIYLDRKN
jgi:hypothetical protein